MDSCPIEMSETNSAAHERTGEADRPNVTEAVGHVSFDTRGRTLMKLETALVRMISAWTPLVEAKGKATAMKRERERESSISPFKAFAHISH